MRLRLEALRELCKRYFGENTAEARGLRLLREWLSPLQRKQFDVRSNFEVIGSDTGRRYRVHYGTAMNVQVNRVASEWAGAFCRRAGL